MSIAVQQTIFVYQDHLLEYVIMYVPSPTQHMSFSCTLGVCKLTSDLVVFWGTLPMRAGCSRAGHGACMRAAQTLCKVIWGVARLGEHQRCVMLDRYLWKVDEPLSACMHVCCAEAMQHDLGNGAAGGAPRACNDGQVLAEGG